MELSRTTLESLDWPVLLDALAERTWTPMGREAALALTPLSPLEIETSLDAIEEVIGIEEDGAEIPLGGMSDIGPLAKRASRGEVLDGPELRTVGQTLLSLRLLSRSLQAREEASPVLAGAAAGIVVDPLISDELEAAFEPNGQLSAATYPVLGELRRRIADLHTGIRNTLDQLVTGDTLGDVLQDRYVTQRNNRYVLPVKSMAKRWDLGIVHGASGSGATVYVEPHQVVALNNKLRLAEADLTAEERRILANLSTAVGSIAAEIFEDLRLVAHIDLVVARRALALSLGATRPKVGSEGVVLLHRGRHPVLVLRGVKVVGNDLAVTSQCPAALLTGPNAGGKTVALKTIGLCVLLTQIGCFIPADAESRVDLFAEVIAAIGDQQDVQEDLSSFSSHLTVLRAMLDGARPGALYLLDELASGTDPSQGAALAQAVMEELLDRGARLVITTHFSRLKILPTTDERFAASAMEYVDGRPTYRVVPGMSGESHALSTASRMGIPDSVVGRARDLLGGEVSLTASLEALDQARQQAEAEAERARAKADELEDQRRALASRESELKHRVERIQEERAAEFLQRLDRAEKAIGAVVADLQRAPDHQRVSAARATVQSLRGLVPEDEIEQSATPTLQVGHRVRLRKLGSTGEVVRLSGKVVTVRAGGVTLSLKPEDLELLSDQRPAQHRPRRQKKKKRRKPQAEIDLTQALRIPSNTVSLRGERVEEGLELAEMFLDQAVLEGLDVVFILHGHGTGAMKQAIRAWLPTCRYVLRWRPANADQGGDAFTIVALRQQS